MHIDWHGIFWFLALVGLLLWLGNWRFLPETLHPSQRQPFHPRHLMRGYLQLLSNPRFLLLALASGVPFNGMFLYVLAAPEFLGTHLALAPTEFFWLFLLTIAGIMGGALVSGRMAGRTKPRHQVRHGFVIMFVTAVVNFVANLLFTAHVSWALIPLALFAFGWALNVPVVTLMVLDLYPERRGMASSLQAVVGSVANGLVAGVIAPMVMHSTVALAATSLAMLCVGLLAWLYLKRRWPDAVYGSADGKVLESTPQQS